MDPQTTWDNMLLSFADDDQIELREHAFNLHTWLAKGGFPPHAVAPERADKDMQKNVAIALCEFIIEHTVEGERDNVL